MKYSNIHQKALNSFILMLFFAASNAFSGDCNDFCDRWVDGGWNRPAPKCLAYKKICTHPTWKINLMTNGLTLICVQQQISCDEDKNDFWELTASGYLQPKFSVNPAYVNQWNRYYECMSNVQNQTDAVNTCLKNLKIDLYVN